MTRSNEPGNSQDEASKWFGHGAQLAGALAGGGVGAIVTGPAGVAYGAIVGTGVTAGLEEAFTRILSGREKKRVSAVAILARTSLAMRLEEGATLRSDDFTQPRLDGRSASDEVIEHVLQTAQRSFEERKLPHVASVLSAVAVSEWLDERTAHWLISSIEQLSWPKLVALSLVSQNAAHPLPDAKVGALIDSWSPWSLHQLFQELQHSENLIHRKTRRGDKGEPVFSSYFSDLKLTPGGELLTWTAKLDEVSATERDTMRASLSASTSTPEAAPEEQDNTTPLS